MKCYYNIFHLYIIALPKDINDHKSVLATLSEYEIYSPSSGLIDIGHICFANPLEIALNPSYTNVQNIIDDIADTADTAGVVSIADVAQSIEDISNICISLENFGCKLFYINTSKTNLDIIQYIPEEYIEIFLFNIDEFKRIFNSIGIY